MDLVTLIVAGLATWRLTSLVVSENGPFNVFRRLREATGITHDSDGEVEMVPAGFFPSLLSCVWCTSVWVGALVSLLWLFSPAFFAKLTLFLALSAVAVMVEKLVRHP